jgi:glycerol-3-phosphate acyltransferase PlsY
MAIFMVFTVTAILIASYLCGAIPFGFLTTKIWTGKDVRQYESGRTGTTNTMRVAGYTAAIITGILDVAKGVAAVLIARAWLPGSEWMQVLAPLAAIAGHNYSIFMLRRAEDGRFYFGGGAGGATGVGGAIGLWWPSVFIIIPIGFLIWFGVGYASLATLSVGIVAAIIFAWRACANQAAWIYVAYGLLAELLLILALRPNIKRLVQGNERLVGWRAKQTFTK